MQGEEDMQGAELAELATASDAPCCIHESTTPASVPTLHLRPSDVCCIARSIKKSQIASSSESAGVFASMTEEEGREGPDVYKCGPCPSVGAVQAWALYKRGPCTSVDPHAIVGPFCKRRLSPAVSQGLGAELSPPRSSLSRLRKSRRACGSGASSLDSLESLNEGESRPSIAAVADT